MEKFTNLIPASAVVETWDPNRWHGTLCKHRDGQQFLAAERGPMKGNNPTSRLPRKSHWKTSNFWRELSSPGAIILIFWAPDVLHPALVPVENRHQKSQLSPWQDGLGEIWRHKRGWFPYKNPWIEPGEPGEQGSVIIVYPEWWNYMKA